MPDKNWKAPDRKMDRALTWKMEVNGHLAWLIPWHNQVNMRSAKLVARNEIEKRGFNIVDIEVVNPRQCMFYFMRGTDKTEFMNVLKLEVFDPNECWDSVM